MRISFLAEAQVEFEEARSYYELQLPGLGARFGDEVRAGLRRIQQWPLATRRFHFE